MRMSRVDLQVARTVISFYREISVDPKIDLVSITGPFSGNRQQFEDKFGS